MADSATKYLQFSYTWILSDVSHLTKFKTGDFEQSSKFTTSMNGQSYTWQLEFYPNGYSEENKGFVSLFLVLISGNRFPVKGNYIISLLTRTYQEVQMEESEETQFQRNKGVGHSRYFSFNVASMEADETLWNDSITIQFRLNIHNKAFAADNTISIENDEHIHFPLSEELEKHFKHIEKPSKDYDILLISSDDQKFYCHHAVLARASSVLANIFNNNNNNNDLILKDKNLDNKVPRIVISDETNSYSEDVTNTEEMVVVHEIVFDDLNAATLRETLRFIYCGKANLSGPEINLQEVISLSYEWNLKMLMSKCEDEIISTHLNPTSACQILLMSVQFGLLRTKRHAIIAILSRMNTVIKSQEWNTIVKQPDLVTEIFRTGPVHLVPFTGVISEQSLNDNEKSQTKPKKKHRHHSGTEQLPLVQQPPKFLPTTNKTTQSQWHDIVRRLQNL